MDSKAQGGQTVSPTPGTAGGGPPGPDDSGAARSVGTESAAPQFEGKALSRPSNSSPGKRETLVAIGIFAAVSWLAHFWGLMQFGLYEDDYTLIGVPMRWSVSGLVQQFLSYVREWPQGRPVGYVVGHLISWIGYRLGGIPLVYLIAFAIVVVNASLIYLLLRRHFTHAAALVGASVYCLYPPDTTKVLLIDGLWLEVSLLYLILATRFYLEGRRKLAYGIILGSLLTYETAFMPFFAVPLLEARLDRRTFRRLVKHAAVLGLFLVCALAIRQVLGEARVGGLSGQYLSTIGKILHSLVIGPFTVLRLFLQRPVEALQLMTPAMAGMAIAGSALLFWAIMKDRAQKLSANATGSRVLPTVRFCAMSAVVMMMGYGLTFTYPYYPPTMEFGRITGVHIAGSLGAALLAGGLASLALFLAALYRVRALAVCLIVGYLGLLIAFQNWVQADFRKSWSFQKEFWTQVVQRCPDLADGTVIFYEREPLPLRYILANSWADAVILRQIFDFPPTWQQPPRLIPVAKDWKDGVAVEGASLKWPVPAAMWAPHWETLPESNVILLTGEIGRVRLKRVFGSVKIHGRDFRLKGASSSPLGSLNHGPLFRHLIDEAELGRLPADQAGELTTLPAPEGMTNLALGRPAQQSSTFQSYGPERGVDGIRRPERFSGFCTQREAHPWWQTDLGSPHRIYQLRLYNGPPFFRAITLKVLYSKDGAKWTEIYDNAGRTFGTEPLTRNEPLVLNISPTTARYIRVQLAQENYLHLEELEVFGQ